MASKRPVPEEATAQAESGSSKRRKPNERGGRSFKKAHTVNETKSRIRSLRRLLEHGEDLPADVRVEKERALQTAEHELDETQRAKKKSDMIVRYHKIRFFDRQKATKRLKRAKKELRACEEDSRREELGRTVDEAEVDLNYALYYPLDQPYVSLFPTRRKGQPEEDEDESAAGRVGKDGVLERQGDEKMRDLVRTCMGNGKLDALRNGKLTSRAQDGKERPTNTNRKGMAKEQRSGKRKDGRDGKRAAPDDAEDDDSDGGFFE